MIQANEIRLGIWCSRIEPDEKSDGNILGERVNVRLDEDDLEVLYGARNYGDLEPIPLTPEILGKAGFVKDADVVCEDSYGWELSIPHYQLKIYLGYYGSWNGSLR